MTLPGSKLWFYDQTVATKFWYFQIVQTVGLTPHRYISIFFFYQKRYFLTVSLFSMSQKNSFFDPSKICFTWRDLLFDE